MSFGHPYSNKKRNITFNFNLMKCGIGAEVENDILVKDVPFLIFTSSLKSVCMLDDICFISSLEDFNTPFLFKDIEVNPAIFGMRVFRENRQTLQLIVEAAIQFVLEGRFWNTLVVARLESGWAEPFDSV